MAWDGRLSGSKPVRKLQKPCRLSGPEHVPLETRTKADGKAYTDLRQWTNKTREWLGRLS